MTHLFHYPLRVPEPHPLANVPYIDVRDARGDLVVSVKTTGDRPADVALARDIAKFIECNRTGRMA